MHAQADVWNSNGATRWHWKEQDCHYYMDLSDSVPMQFSGSHDTLPQAV